MKTARKLNPAILVLLLVLAFAAEAFMGNYSYLINNSGDCDVRDYRCDSLQQIIEINGENDYFIIDDVDFKVGSVSFIADATRMTDAKATVYAKNSPMMLFSFMLRRQISVLSLFRAKRRFISGKRRITIRFISLFPILRKALTSGE